MKLFKLNLLLVILLAGRVSAAETAYLYGIHDHDPRPDEYIQRIRNVVPGGWATATVAIGHDPNDQSGVDFTWFAKQNVTVICRINNGYFPNGTIPLFGDYEDFATRCANFVKNSPGCNLWVIGNELNIAGEWPASGTYCGYVSPASYATCYRGCYNAIKAVSPNAKILTQPCAPFSGPFGAGSLGGGYTHAACPLSWVEYEYQQLQAILDLGCPIDGIALHVTSRGYNYSDIHSTAVGSINGKLLSWSFNVYKDWVNYGIPASLYNLPLYMTECNGYYYWKGGHPENPPAHYQPGWVQEVYKEINDYNRNTAVPQGKPIYRCINFYRWCNYCDGWNIDSANPPFTNPYKSQILSDLDGALAFEYTWPGSVTVAAAWSDDFEDGHFDEDAPEPEWVGTGQSGGDRQETGGWLRLTGAGGSPSQSVVKNSEWKVYQNFIVTAKINLANITSTDGSSGSAEIRFRANNSGVGYSLTFKPNDEPTTISLRRTDTGDLVQGKEVTYSLPSGTTLYVNLATDGSLLTVHVGTTDGGSDVVNWSFSDTTFANKGCFWLVNNQLMDVRFDYFNYLPVPAGIQGIVRDSLGNLLQGATVATNVGGYSATTSADGSFSILHMNPGAYDVTASKANYRSSTTAGVAVTTGTITLDFTITDNTRAPDPTVIDAGTYQTSNDSITFSYSAYDPESPITGYWTAVSTSPNFSDIITGGAWQSVGLQTTHTRTGLNLENGRTYYALVKARNAVNLMSGNGASDGIAIAKGVSSIGLAKAESNTLMIALADKPVTAKLSDCSYIEEPDRISGIKVMTTAYDEGALVDVAGYLSLVNGERRITPSFISAPDSGSVPRPLGLQNRALGGGAFNAYTPGITGGKGMNTIGLLVIVWGKVTDVQTGYFILDDGSCPLKVLSPFIPPINTDVRVTGICSVESSGGTVTRLLRARKRADVVP